MRTRARRGYTKKNPLEQRSGAGAWLALFAVMALGCGEDKSASEESTKDMGDAGGMSSVLPDAAVTPDSGIVIPELVDAGAEAEAGPRIACRMPATPVESEVPEHAVPREACSDLQIQEFAAIAAKQADPTPFKTAHADCYACVVSDEGKPRGPLFLREGKIDINYDGCLALRSNPACGTAIADTALCNSVACYSCSDPDLLACALEAEQTDCKPALDREHEACAGIDERNIGAGCLVQDSSVAGMTTLYAAMIGDFCGKQTTD